MAKGAMQKSKLLYLAKIFSENTDEEHGLTVNELIHIYEKFVYGRLRKKEKIRSKGKSNE